jgi:hypothetical protein
MSAKGEAMLRQKVLAFAIPFLVAATASANAEFGETTITKITSRNAGTGIEILVNTDQPPMFQSFFDEKAKQVVVELIGGTFDRQVKAPALAQGFGKMQLVTHQGKQGKVARMQIPSPTRPRMDVDATGRQLRVKLETLSGVRLAQADEEEEEEAGMATAEDSAGTGASGNRLMTYIGFRNSASSSRVYARMNGKAEFKVLKEGSDVVVLEIQNATIPLRNNRRFLDTSYFDSPIKMITPSNVDDVSPSIRITIELREGVPYESKVEGEEIHIIFKKGG